MSLRNYLLNNDCAHECLHYEVNRLFRFNFISQQIAL